MQSASSDELLGIHLGIQSTYHRVLLSVELSFNHLPDPPFLGGEAGQNVGDVFVLDDSNQYLYRPLSFCLVIEQCNCYTCERRNRGKCLLFRCECIIPLAAFQGEGIRVKPIMFLIITVAFNFISKRLPDADVTAHLSFTRAVPRRPRRPPFHGRLLSPPSLPDASPISYRNTTRHRPR